MKFNEGARMASGFVFWYTKATFEWSGGLQRKSALVRNFAACRASIFIKCMTPFAFSM